MTDVAAPLARGGIDTDLIRGPRVAIGRFRCPVSYPAFRNTGAIPECIVVFPRTGVWIQHDGSPRFLADPTIVTMYNRSQQYERFAASPEGDRCDWFAVSDDLAREIVSAVDDSAGDSERPFRFQWAPSSAPVYLRQRVLSHRASIGALDALEAEEGVIAIVASVLDLAYAQADYALARRRSSLARHRAIADAARAYISETIAEQHSVHDIAAAIGTSPFHLCRVFHACVGRTLHNYRTELRVRVGFEALEMPAASGATLSSIAHALGFASHPHFAGVMRRLAGITPSEARALVASRFIPMNRIEQ